ncbi:MAG: TonB-dependent receptor [Deltaproteobacteria bacterium]|nr:TonB-dependent receptor [Deltaproteobacteria bacterium]
MRRLALLLGLVLTFTAAPAMADARAKARRHFAEALRLLAEKQFDAAITEFARANEALPHADVIFNLARACESAGRNREALEWFERYLEQRPLDTEARVDRDRVAALVAAETRPPVEPESTERSKDAEALHRAAALLPKGSPDRLVLEALEKHLKAGPADGEARREPEPERPTQPAAPPPEPPRPRRDGALVGPTDSTPSLPKSVSVPRGQVRAIEAYEEKEIVAAASRRAAAPSEAPAVVWVITAKEIRRRGYESVAEALENVAGLHVIDDHVFVDVGVRGVHAGLRGQSRVIRVLIDGQPVAYRPTSGNFLGPEMIPIRAVERIELIKGPASALYGANAFLGVLAIVTKRGGDLRGGAIAARIGVDTHAESPPDDARAGPSFAGDFVLGTQAGRMSVLLAASAARLDRSGLRVPESSALFDRLVLDRGGFSQNDLSRPASYYGSLTYDLQEAGQLSLSAGLQRLDSSAEWLDVGALSHGSRAQLENSWVRLAYEGAPTKRFGLFAFLSLGLGSTGPDQRLLPLRIGASKPDLNTHLVTRASSQSVFTGAEARFDGLEELSLRVGADLDLDTQSLEESWVVFDVPVGSRRPGDSVKTPSTLPFDRQKLQNVGAYVQASARPSDWLDLIGGLRFDYHNLYKSSFNGRVGSVFRIGDYLFAKALYGSSFRAPAADQLFHDEAFTGDIIGCRNYAPCQAVGLEPQRAHTAELVLGASFSDSFSGQLTGFVSFVDELIVSFPNTGEFFVTSNAGSYLSTGLELELSTSLVKTTWLELAGHAHLAIESTEARIPEGQFDPPEAIRSEFRDASLYPPVSGGTGLASDFPAAHLSVYAEARYVGRRRASGSNLALSPASYDDGHLPGFVTMDLNVSTRDLFLFGEGESVVSLRVDDLFHEPKAEGGHRGWDIPLAGRTVFLRLIQEL